MKQFSLYGTTNQNHYPDIWVVTRHQNKISAFVSQTTYCIEIRPNFSGSHTFSLTATAKIGPDTNSLQLCSLRPALRPDFGRNADWLSEQCFRIWLAVEINGSWQHLFLAWLFSWMIRRRRRGKSILLPFLLFYGLMAGKYVLICAIEIQKIHMVVHIFLRNSFIYGTNVSVSRPWIPLQVGNR